METRTHSPWMSGHLEELGFDVTVADARRLRMILASDRKSDARDAEMLARMLRFDPELLYGVSTKDSKRRRRT